jgi:hypothetical protein
MQQFFDLNKNGTVILSAGRAGSHLVGDLLTSHLQQNSIPAVNLEEYFWVAKTQSVKQFNTLVDNLNLHKAYQIIQVQDFTNQVRIINFASAWLENYHVVHLTRDNLLSQFFGLHILYNFYNFVPTHSVKGVKDSFNYLADKRISVSQDDVYQFLSHCNLLKLINNDFEISYENVVTSLDLSKSKYQKNSYPLTAEQFFINHDDVVKWLYGKD